MTDFYGTFYCVKKAVDALFDTSYVYIFIRQIVVKFLVIIITSKKHTKSLIISKNLNGNYNFQNITLLA
jgi:hypothetical protein